AKAMVIGPSLPRYIQKVIKTLPTADKSGVNPLLAPTVASAETVSYKISTRGALSVIVKTKLTERIMVIDTKNIAKAFLNTSVPINLPKTTGSLSPLTTEWVDRKSTPSVVVLIPPAVDPGEPPTNIRPISIRAVESFIFARFTE